MENPEEAQFPPGTWRTQRRLNSLLEPGEPRGGSIPSWNMENPEEAQFPPETWRTQRRLNSLLEHGEPRGGSIPSWNLENPEEAQTPPGTEEALSPMASAKPRRRCPRWLLVSSLG